MRRGREGEVGGDEERERQRLVGRVCGEKERVWGGVGGRGRKRVGREGERRRWEEDEERGRV
eukprot:1927342-Rhodomonas_salina.1